VLDIVGRFVLSSAHSMKENVDAAQTAEGETAELRRGWDWWVLPLVIVALTLLTLQLPQEVLKGNIDDSWNAALVYAHVNHFKFGDDVVFPYGPLGYLVTNHFLPDTAVPRLLLGLATTALTVTGLCLLAWRMKWPWRVA